TGIVGDRYPGKFVALLIIESIAALVVAISNAVVIVVYLYGWKRLMKNNFYVVVSNLIVFTSLKCIIELGFIVPYYVLRNEEEKPVSLSIAEYELIIFNLSVLADYGVLFFSALIAVNRYLTVAISTSNKPQRMPTVVSCVFTWLCSGAIPLLYFVCECKYDYSFYLKLYYNRCEKSTPFLEIVLKCLIYLTYACTVAVLALYLLIFIFLRRKQRANLNRENLGTSRHAFLQMRLLRQSVVVFTLYTGSMLCVFLLTHVSIGAGKLFEVAYAENLLNLSIAAVYPICFLVMSGEMKSVLISRFITSRSSAVASVSPHPNRSSNNGAN
ncbi:hypothetical protein PFISCL1PPCAC_13013, partial [Pristionchus fissidentatus]